MIEKISQKVLDNLLEVSKDWKLFDKFEEFLEFVERERSDIKLRESLNDYKQCMNLQDKYER